jgi:hypothetical protein
MRFPPSPLATIGTDTGGSIRGGDRAIRRLSLVGLTRQACAIALSNRSAATTVAAIA